MNTATVHQLPAMARRVRAGQPVPQENERLSHALQAAYTAGHEAGERTGYKAGVRWGAIAWVCVGFLAGGGVILLGEAVVTLARGAL
jgi:hypothetical protein